MRILFLLMMLGGLGNEVSAQREANYDEAKVPDYALPEILVDLQGNAVTNPSQWGNRRAEILAMFESSVYGKTPKDPVEVSYRIHKSRNDALGGIAVQKEVIATFRKGSASREMNILIFLPKNVQGKVPVFLGLNFNGNHTIHADTSITLTGYWVRNKETQHKATEASRGMNASRWAIEEIIRRGYAVATVYCGDLDPDYDDGFQNGIHPLFYKSGQTRPEPDEWGTIGAWAWGLSRVMDYFEQDPDIDHKKVAVLGHSRLGKAALWAGAQDTRFAVVISNNSGCGGSALSRRKFGETVRIINTSFPHWFCENFKEFNDREEQVPVDQHMLLALIAPRSLYVASAEEDLWADPKGEFLSLHHAGAAYGLFGYGGIEQKPAVNNPVVNGKLGYHIRSGKHDVTRYDWDRYIEFVDHQLGTP
ncbi:MAG TPA: hypothetical protein VKZ51_10725 [Cyclobacteriaceae bacterium]|nr:hypothetical protein [Cyclobacteriaceae bacterium]